MRPCGFVRGQVVRDHDIAGLQTRRELSFDIGIERRPVHRPVQHPGGGQFIDVQPGDKCLRAPVTERGICLQPRPTRATSAQACHPGGDGGFINENNPMRLKAHPWLAPVAPLVSRGVPLFAPPLRRNQRFFHMCNQGDGSGDATALPASP